MKETEVYSWRLAFELKQALEEAAKAEKISLAQLLERIVLEWLALNSEPDTQEEDIQRMLHQSAARAFGTIQGGDPSRSPQASQQMKFKLRDRLAAQRTH
ncbi:MAG: hypothetical protein WBB01_23910 [Phormidesmis sp.]